MEFRFRTLIKLAKKESNNEWYAKKAAKLVCYWHIQGMLTSYNYIMMQTEKVIVFIADNLLKYRGPSNDFK